jgi:Holliday junction resolvase RusA-like endonuclease
MTHAHDDYMQIVKGHAMAAWAGPPLEGPVEVVMQVGFSPPKSLSKRKTAAMINHLHDRRPDADNVAKIVLDGLSGIAFVDDNQVAILKVVKFWTATPGVEVTVKTLVDMGAIR